MIDIFILHSRVSAIKGPMRGRVGHLEVFLWSGHLYHWWVIKRRFMGWDLYCGFFRFIADFIEPPHLVHVQPQTNLSFPPPTPPSRTTALSPYSTCIFNLEIGLGVVGGT